MAEAPVFAPHRGRAALHLATGENRGFRLSDAVPDPSRWSAAILWASDEPALALLAGTAALVPLIPTNLLGDSGQNSFVVTAEQEPGTSLETTAAAAGQQGVVRRDPFAMLPFCGYNMADYFGHWLKVGQGLRFDRAPRIFQVNWFRKGSDGRFLWPGFGDNVRVLDWIVRRIQGEVSAVDSPIGRLPHTSDLNLDGIDTTEQDLAELFAIDSASWQQEADLTQGFFDEFGGRIPAPLQAELEALRYRLGKV